MTRIFLTPDGAFLIGRVISQFGGWIVELLKYIHAFININPVPLFLSFFSQKKTEKDVNYRCFQVDSLRFRA